MMRSYVARAGLVMSLRAGAVARQRGANGRWGDALVVKVQGHGVSDEVLGSGLKAKLLVDLLHSILVKVDT